MKPNGVWRTRCGPNLCISRISLNGNSKSCRSMRRGDVGVARQKKASNPAGHRGREVILGIQRDLRSEGFAVPVSLLCHWFKIPSRTVYYKPTKAVPKVKDRFEKPIDRQSPLVCLLYGSRFVEPQEKHGIAHLSNSRLAIQATADCLSPTRASHAIGSQFARLVLGNRLVSRPDGPRWLGQPGVGD
jgi:hypothetical protein